MLDKKTILVTFTLFFALSALVYLTGFGGGFDGLVGNFLYLFPSAIAALCGWYASRKYGINNIHGKSTLFLTVGIAFLSLGEIHWVLFDFFLNIDPYPSIADAFYLLSYPFIFIGLFQEIKVARIDWTKKSILDSILFLVVIGSAITYFNIIPAYNGEEPFINNFVAILYGLGDLVILSAIIFIVNFMNKYQGGKLFYSWCFIFFGFLFILIADTLWNIFREGYEEKIWIYKQIDLLWMLAYLLIAYGLFDIGNLITTIQKKIANKLS